MRVYCDDKQYRSRVSVSLCAVDRYGYDLSNRRLLHCYGFCLLRDIDDHVMRGVRCL
jgi:hypothetical protein